MFTLDKSARKRIITGIAAALGTALIGFEALPTAQAAPPPHAPAWGYRRKQQQNSNYRPNYRRRHRPMHNDIDGDGIFNSRDRDVDGDGIPNGRDRDIDGDGISNSRDRFDYVSARWQRDRRGNWFLRRAGSTRVVNRAPYGYYRDSSGRLVPRRSQVKQSTFTRTRRVGDKDGDGIRNRRDRDIDGDGVRNWRDRDRDGDRVRNKRDRFDKNPRRR